MAKYLEREDAIDELFKGLGDVLREASLINQKREALSNNISVGGAKVIRMNPNDPDDLMNQIVMGMNICCNRYEVRKRNKKVFDEGVRIYKDLILKGIEHGMKMMESFDEIEKTFKENKMIKNKQFHYEVLNQAIFELLGEG